MDIRQRIQDALRQAKTGVTAEDVETLAVEQSVARLSADAWRDLQEACTAMEEALKALYAMPDRVTWAQHSPSVREGVAREEAALAGRLGLSRTVVRRLQAALGRARQVDAVDAAGRAAPDDESRLRP
jgi:DNA-binding GntR family transcriptional regulator